MMQEKQMWLIMFCVTSACLVLSCVQNDSGRFSKDKKLPIYGFKQYKDTVIDGQTTIDTLYHRIPSFRFQDQDSVWISQKDVDGKVYIADFFFTTCPDICPIMSHHLLTVYKQYKHRADFNILSHTIDPYNDSIPALKVYAQNLGVADNQTWHFLYGEQDTVFVLAKKGYMAAAALDANAPRGVMHSGAFILVDKKSRVRGVYDGTKPAGLKKLLHDLEILFDKG